MSPRSSQANEQLREQSRERILTAALDVFVEKGYHTATISDITARAGVSRGLITYYFPSKEHLIRELLQQYLELLIAVVAVTGTPDERLAATIDGILGGAARTLPVQRLMLSVMVHPSTHPLFASVERDLQDHLTQLEDTLRDLFAARGSTDPALDEVTFRTVMEGAIFKASVYRDQYPMERVRGRVYELYGLPAPRTALVDPDPAPVGRMRATD